MSIVFEQREDSSLLSLEGVIDIATAAELKTALIDALKPGLPVRIALHSNTDLDVTAFQLLWAAEREARAQGVQFTLAGELPQTISAALMDAGFERFPVPV